MHGNPIGGLLCGLAVGLTIGTLVGAVILRAAVSLFNSLAGGSDPVDEPQFGKALLITFVTSIAQFGAQFVIGLMAATALQDLGQVKATLIAQLASIPVSFLILSAMLTAMLPTHFGRAVGIAFCYLLVVILIAVVLMGVAFAVGVGFGGGRGF